MGERMRSNGAARTWWTQTLVQSIGAVALTLLTGLVYALATGFEHDPLHRASFVLPAMLVAMTLWILLAAVLGSLLRRSTPSVRAALSGLLAAIVVLSIAVAWWQLGTGPEIAGSDLAWIPLWRAAPLHLALVAALLAAALLGLALALDLAVARRWSIVVAAGLLAVGGAVTAALLYQSFFASWWIVFVPVEVLPHEILAGVAVAAFGVAALLLASARRWSWSALLAATAIAVLALSIALAPGGGFVAPAPSSSPSSSPAEGAPMPEQTQPSAPALDPTSPPSEPEPAPTWTVPDDYAECAFDASRPGCGG
ncbi:hypothetical protein [Arenivirga flava]|uniref:Uncharacterized protein n=1 Tax=Arenivirga flava TaxID=1930060 RepID=A0AA37UDU5_9MICO|nr:hypothetical protein [Arenivirga flava]GMA27278.1 hypothetical protein GCM10025874_05310 [Arenivirga flava]